MSLSPEDNSGGGSENVGYVSGRVDRPITQTQRQEGQLGYLAEEWVELASQVDTAKPSLYYEHKHPIGHLLRTWIDDEGFLCADAIINKDSSSVARQVHCDLLAGKLNCLSIAYDALLQKNAKRPYYKNDFKEFSICKRGKFPPATIAVRASMTSTGEADAGAETKQPPQQQQPPPQEEMPLDDPIAMQKLLAGMDQADMMRQFIESKRRERDLAPKAQRAEAYEQEQAKKRAEEEATRLKASEEKYLKMEAEASQFLGDDFDDAKKAQLKLAMTNQATAPLASLMESMHAKLTEANAALQKEREMRKRSDSALAAVPRQQSSSSSSSADQHAKRQRGQFVDQNASKTSPGDLLKQHPGGVDWTNIFGSNAPGPFVPSNGQAAKAAAAASSSSKVQPPARNTPASSDSARAAAASTLAPVIDPLLTSQQYPSAVEVRQSATDDGEVEQELHFNIQQTTWNKDYINGCPSMIPLLFGGYEGMIDEARRDDQSNYWATNSKKARDEAAAAAGGGGGAPMDR